MWGLHTARLNSGGTSLASLLFQENICLFIAESILHTIPIIDSGNVFRFLLKPGKLSDGIDVLLKTVYRREKTKASSPAHLFKTGHY